MGKTAIKILFYVPRIRFGKNGINNMDYPFFQCHLFNGCSLNSCPLDPMYPNRFAHIQDKYKVCRCKLEERLSIAANFPELPYKGMTVTEFNEKTELEAL